MEGVPHVTARVAVKELQAEGLLRARCLVVWCPGASTRASQGSGVKLGSHLLGRPRDHHV